MPRPSQTSLSYQLVRRLLWLCGCVVLSGLVFALSGCGAHPDDLERCGFVAPEHATEPALRGLGVRRSALACGPGTPQYPPARNFPKAIEGYASYVGQSKCDPTAKPGMIAFKDLILKTYPCTGNFGISRACSRGGKSEHKEGRAWDWKLNYPHPAADAVIKWLLATDKYGNKHANARRIGLMYMIWNRKIWSASRASQGWRAYTGASPHTDHIHFSLSWDGANKKTSYWKGDVAPPTKLDAKLVKKGSQQTYPKSGGADFSVCPGQSFQMTFSVQNTGNIAWRDINKTVAGDAVRLGHKKGDKFGLSSRISINTASKKVAKPGETTTFSLSVKAPSKSGVLQSEWQMVSEMVAWFGPLLAHKIHVTTQPPGYGKACTLSGKSGDCGAGLMKCSGGKLRCVAKVPGKPETCNNKDDDCDGIVDEGNPGGGKPCETLKLGACKAGVMTCKEGALRCLSRLSAKPEVCDQKDNDCDGHVDEEGACQGTTPSEPTPFVDAGGSGDSGGTTIQPDKGGVTKLDDDQPKQGSVLVLDAGQGSGLSPQPGGCACHSDGFIGWSRFGGVAWMLLLGWVWRRKVRS